MITQLIDKVNRQNMKEEMPQFEIGDTVRVHNLIKEGGKERIQMFAGVVIARDGGGATETFTVRRITQGEGVEKVFPVHSPHVAEIEVQRSGKVRRAKLYYLRELTGKKARIEERRR